MTIGEDGATIPANTLIKTALQIINGVEPGVPLLDMIECTKYTIKKLVVSSSTDVVTISHGLGKIPKLVIIATLVDPDSVAESFLRFSATFMNETGSGYSSMIKKIVFDVGNSNRAQGYDSSHITGTASQIKTSSGFGTFTAGAEYNIISMTKEEI